MKEKLSEILTDLGIVSTVSKQKFLDEAKVIELPKNHHIFLEGKENQYEYILISGVLHRYNVSDRGDTVTTGFYMPKSVITPHFARTFNGKSIFSLQCLTDVVLAQLLVTDLDRLRYINEECNEFGQQVVMISARG